MFPFRSLSAKFGRSCTKSLHSGSTEEEAFLKGTKEVALSQPKTHTEQAEALLEKSGEPNYWSSSDPLEFFLSKDTQLSVWTAQLAVHYTKMNFQKLPEERAQRLACLLYQVGQKAKGDESSPAIRLCLQYLTHLKSQRPSAELSKEVAQLAITKLEKSLNLENYAELVSPVVNKPGSARKKKDLAVDVLAGFGDQSIF
ncbi:hypothetical protein O181_060049 [Austropuccinia psidii MF-1]|uniref:Uncharacterized protein n=1 Tax=Austropuccinia psidii MF-1 TaxID=1389203 RepID=A0A9Q3EFG6_9BASI|nr:hypothetical protein [Austropuccinia psidii MF-1]